MMIYLITKKYINKLVQPFDSMSGNNKDADLMLCIYAKQIHY